MCHGGHSLHRGDWTKIGIALAAAAVAPEALGALAPGAAAGAGGMAAGEGLGMLGAADAASLVPAAAGSFDAAAAGGLGMGLEAGGGLPAAALGIPGATTAGTFDAASLGGLGMGNEAGSSAAPGLTPWQDAQLRLPGWASKAGQGLSNLSKINAATGLLNPPHAPAADMRPRGGGSTANTILYPSTTTGGTGVIPPIGYADPQLAAYLAAMQRGGY